MIVASAVFSQHTRVTDNRQTDYDRQHLIPTAELAMQLQCSAKNGTRRGACFFGGGAIFDLAAVSPWQGLRHGFDYGGTISRAKQAKNFGPPNFAYLGGHEK